MGGGKCEQKTQVHVVCHIGINEVGEVFCRNKRILDDHIGGGAEDHGKDIHKDHAGEIVQIKSERTHG